MVPTAQLDGGGAGGLAFVAGDGETVAIDNGARTARVGEETRFTWTGFTGFSVRGGTVTFEGTDADESVRGYIRSATMGAGDDVASTTRSDGGPTLLDTAIDGGAGHDLLRVSGGQFAETTDPRRVEIDVSAGRATADWHAIDFRDFEAFHAYVEGTAVIRGSSGDDELSGTACDLEIRGNGGDDRITTDSNPDELYCDGPVSTRLVGGPGDDFIRTTQYFYGGTVLAGPGDDVVIGGRGADVVDAGPGADLVRGDQGPDDIRGGPGDDRLRGGAEDDLVRGGAGRDTCTAEVERSCERS